MIEGDVIVDGWRSTEVRDALDLCLGCKGCKSDCPVGVDVAAYKSEFLHQHYKRRLRPRSHYSLGWLPIWLRMGERMPRVVNTLTRGNNTRYAPITPLIAPDAPTMGMMDWVSAMTCASAAATPHSR